MSRRIRYPERLHPWKLTSIGSETQRTFLTNAFAAANVLATLSQGYTVPEQNAQATQVFEWLYGTERADLMRISVSMAAQGMSSNAVPVVGEPRGGSTAAADVRVYCTHDRIREGRALASGEKRWFDPAIKEFLKSKFNCTQAFAWTIVPDDEHQNQPDTLQLCPWFLDYAMKQSNQFQNKFKPGKIASMITKLKMDRLATWAKYTPIDLFQLFDKVILHELAHTRSGGSAEDIGGFSGYGWKNCRRLSTQRGEKSPHRNADTIALFASISGLLNEGGMVNGDGSFVRGPGAGGGNEEGGDVATRGATKRSTVALGWNGDPLFLEERAPQFNATSLKGRPLF